MVNKWNLILCFGLLLGTASYSIAQQLTFRYLGNDQGMNSTTSWYCTIDKYGFIWVATSDGLVRFDGKETTYYFQQTNPELPTDQIGYVYCDSRNYVWICTELGLVSLDGNRKFKRQNIIEEDTAVHVAMCIESGDSVIYAFTTKGIYSLLPDLEKWMPEPWLDSLISSHRIRDLRRFDKDRILIVMPAVGVLLVNTKTKTSEAFFEVKGVNCATRFDAESILIGKSGSYGLIHARIDQPSKLNIIPAPSFFHPNDFHEQIIYMTKAADHNVYMTTEGKGLVRIDNTLTTYTHYEHDPVNPYTIINNSLRFITADSSGDLVMTSLDGVNYSNVNNNSIEYINYQQTQYGELIDDRVIGIAEDINQKLWICTKENLLVYDPVLKSSKNITIPFSKKLNSSTHYPMWVERDMDGKMWIALKQEGVAIFNAEGRFIKLLSSESYPGFGNEIDHPRIIRQGPDGYMYIGTEDGLCRVSHNAFVLDTFPTQTEIVPLRKRRIVDILFDDGSIWVSTSPNGAAWHYSFKENKLEKFDTDNGMISNRVYGLTADKNGNIYAGSRNGLAIIHPNDSISNLSKGHGLVSDRIEAIETAVDGTIWMTNSYALLKYDPETGDVFKLGGRQGLMNANFAIMASANVSYGKLAFGVSKGLIIVDPAAIRFNVDSLRIFVFYRNAEGKEVEWPADQKMEFNYKQNNFQFSFAINDIMIADQVLFKYKLSAGEPGNWSVPSLNSKVDFNLNSGTYMLEVQAFDGHEWFSLANPIRFQINLPWWKQWWFILLLTVGVLTILLTYFNGRIQKFRKELVIARQITDLESKALRAQMNPHFVFNSLNAIQECIVTGRVEEAYTYLSTFSKLLRLVLEHSEEHEVTLQEELEVFSLYLSLEKLRFKDDMQYSLHLEDELDPEEILIPPMLIQPHLENAIWHGLRHKEGEKHLTVSISETPSGYLEVIVEDDGIGRVKAGALREARLGGNKHRSKGKQLSENRMMLLANSYPSTSMIIKDLYDDQGKATGTKVILTIPMLNKRTGTVN